MNLYLQALFGGLLIGFSVTLLLIFNGKVTGISGIIGGLLKPQKHDAFWRISFILGMLTGGLMLKIFYPESLTSTVHSSTAVLVSSGLLVGFGTLLGNGCTSGHGICGISRLSARSILATLVFMASGIITVYLMKVFGA